MRIPQGAGAFHSLGESELMGSFTLFMQLLERQENRLHKPPVLQIHFLAQPAFSD
jgi:hypothetical protein